MCCAMVQVLGVPPTPGPCAFSSSASGHKGERPAAACRSNPDLLHYQARPCCLAGAHSDAMLVAVDTCRLRRRAKSRRVSDCGLVCPPRQAPTFYDESPSPPAPPGTVWYKYADGASPLPSTWPPAVSVHCTEAHSSDERSLRDQGYVQALKSRRPVRNLRHPGAGVPPLPPITSVKGLGPAYRNYTWMYDKNFVIRSYSFSNLDMVRHCPPLLPPSL